MTESRVARCFLRLGAGLTLAFIYLPLILVAVYAFNESITQALADRELLDQVVQRGVPRPGRSRRAPALRQGGAGSNRRGPRSRGAALARDGALLVLRARHGHAARDPPDRAARHHHRPGAPDDVHDGRHRLRAHDDHHRARDVLHRRRIQQRSRPPPAAARQPRGGVQGSRRRLVADVPPRDTPADGVGDARRRAAGLRSLMGRGRGDHLHLRGGADAAHLDLLEPLPSPSSSR